MTKKNKVHSTSYHPLSQIDDLTGVYNRRYLKVLEKQVAALREKNRPFSIAVIDIDHFKEVNDIHGHAKGDEVIKEFAQFLKAMLRTTDTVIRYGGDAFICVMFNLETKDIRHIYSRLLERCHSRTFSGLGLTISIGVASCPKDSEEFNALLRIADESLYDAKRSGRNRIGVTRKKRIELPTKAYIGRKKEIGDLLRMINEGGNVGSLAIVEGNIGIGKTRFVKEVLNGVRGHEIMWSDCLAFFEGIPYYPMRELIRYKINRWGRKVLETVPLVYRMEIAKLLPELKDDVKGKTDDIDLLLDKYRLYESIRMIIELGHRKKIVVIDNMQWSDRESIETLRYLLRSLRKHPITFILICRAEEKVDFFEDFTSFVSRETMAKDLKLEAFGAQEITEIVKSIISDVPDERLLRYIGQESGGNPFYIEEIVKELYEHGFLKQVNDSWYFEAPGFELIPKSIGDVTARKYTALSREGREVVEIASVIGSFDIDLIRSLTGYNEGHVIGVLEKIKHLGLIKEDQDRIEFREGVSRDAIYQKNLLGIRARMLHRMIGQKLEERYQGHEHEVIDELAVHFYRGLDRERGIRYCIEAGARAREKYANTSAISYLTWAEELLRDETNSEKRVKRIDCLITRADIYSFIGDHENALKDLEEGLQQAQVLDLKSREAEIGLKRANLHFHTAQYGAAMAQVKRCLQIFRDVEDKKGIANALNIMGNCHASLGRFKTALSFFEKSLGTFRELHDQWHIAAVMNNLGLVHKCLADYSKALKFFRNSLSIKDEHKYIRSAALNNMGLVYVEIGEYKEALKSYQDAIRIIADTGHKSGEALILNNIGIVYDHLGDYEKAVNFFEDSYKIASDIEQRHFEANGCINLGICCTKTGDYERALSYFKSAHKIVERIGSDDLLFNYLLPLADFYLSQRKLKMTKSVIDRAYKVALRTHSKEMLNETTLILCELYLERKDYDKYKSKMKKFLPASKELHSKVIEYKINLLQGRYFTEIEDFEKATRHLHEAMKICEDMSDRYALAVVCYYRAILDLAMGETMGYQKNLKKAMDVFTSINAKAWKQKITNSLRSQDAF